MLKLLSGSGEIWFFAAGAIALAIWSPAFVVAWFAARRAHSYLRRRGVAIPTSRAIAASLALVILVVYLPVYVIAILSFLDLVT